MTTTDDLPTFEPPRQSLERPDVLTGTTYKLRTPMADGNDATVYLTVNELDGRPFEVFLNSKNATVTELLGVTMVLISRLLRLSVPLESIATDLEQVASAQTAHFADRQWWPSMIARIGNTLKAHESRRQASLDLHSRDEASTSAER